MEQTPCRVIGAGKVYFDYGPVSMVVMAYRGQEPLTEACIQAFQVIDGALKEITASLNLLKLYPSRIPAGVLEGLPLEMYKAVRDVGEPTLTPMATVAGAVSDTVADHLKAIGATKVVVNNGGDIALRLDPGEEVRVGIMSSLAEGKIDNVVNIRAADGIGGIATSGLGGRSFTRGVAQGVSAFASRCILADALATHLANSSYIVSERVLTTKAGALDPLSDISDLEVVVGVDRLTDREVQLACENLLTEARRQQAKGNLSAMRARIQDQRIDLPGGIL
ncbi:MAG: hypothetical protein VB085_07140 [Peptococcaceae bacterium]|nr:hypothetical protein [Peptococcaceae bacterium]